MKKSYSISLTLIVILFLGLTGALGGMGLMHYYDSRSQWQERLDNQAEQIAQRLSLTLKEPLWNLDITQVEKVLLSEMKAPDVAQIMVIDAIEDIYVAGVRDKEWNVQIGTEYDKEIDSYIISESRISRDEYKIGTVAVHVTTMFLEERLHALLMKTVAIVVVADAVLLTLIFLVIKYVLISPLRLLQGYSRSVGQGNLETPLPYLRRYSGEISQLGGFVSNMVQYLKKSIQIETRQKEVIRESQRQLNTLMSNLPGMVYRCRNDSNRTMEFVSQGSYDLCGYKPEELMGNRVVSYNEVILPDYRDWIWEAWQNALSLKKKLTIEYEIQDKDGTFKWVWEQGQGIFSENGELKALEGFITDISEKKKAQEALAAAYEDLEVKLEERTRDLQMATQVIVETEKMVLLGELVAGVAHEINTPIGVSVSAASYLESINQKYHSMLLESRMTKEDLVDYINEVNDSTVILEKNLLAAAELISNFKRMAVNQSLDIAESFNMKEYLDMIILSLKHEYKRTRHKITVDCPDDLILNSYPGIFSQIFTNLIMNSIIHGFENTKRGVININVSLDDNDICIDYCDNGKGIPEDKQHRIFDMFFTTQKHKGSSGLGLHIIYNLITYKLKGSIICESTPGKGTCFRISFPVTVEAEEKI